MYLILEIISQCTSLHLSSDIPINDGNTPSLEMLEDNINVTITPFWMTVESKRKILHWILIMMKQKLIMDNDMDISEVYEFWVDIREF